MSCHVKQTGARALAALAPCLLGVMGHGYRALGRSVSSPGRKGAKSRMGLSLGGLGTTQSSQRSGQARRSKSGGGLARLMIRDRLDQDARLMMAIKLSGDEDFIRLSKDLKRRFRDLPDHHWRILEDELTAIRREHHLTRRVLRTPSRSSRA